MLLIFEVAALKAVVTIPIRLISEGDEVGGVSPQVERTTGETHMRDHTLKIVGMQAVGEIAIRNISSAVSTSFFRRF